MDITQLFYIMLAVWSIAYGVSVFLPERTIVVISAIAAIVTGIIALSLAF